MKHKTGAPMSKLRSLTNAGGKPMSQIAFAQFIGMPSGTLARVEAGAVPLARDAAERIEASCGVDMEKLYEGKLVALDGSAYTAASWRRRQAMELTPEELTRATEELADRVGLLLAALGPKRGLYGLKRVRQLLDGVVMESGLNQVELEMAGRRSADVESFVWTVAQLAKSEQITEQVAKKLEAFSSRQKCKVTTETYKAWPLSHVVGGYMIASGVSRHLWRVVLPNGEKVEFVSSIHTVLGRANDPCFTVTGITPDNDAVRRVNLSA